MSLNEIASVGIHPGVEPVVYHAWKALSHSWLNRLRISPAHLADLMEHGTDEHSSEAQEFGTAVHYCVLEPKKYGELYAVRPEGQNGTTKEGKKFKADAQAAGKTVLSCQEARWCQAIAWRAKMNARLREWLQPKYTLGREVSFVWERDGYLCKGRADLVVWECNLLVDLKTTRTASPKGFAAQVAKYGYHQQAAWYADGLRRLTGTVWDFWFVACEKQRPFLVTCHQLVRDSPAHLRAVAENDRLFEVYKQCCQTRHWPGYGDCFEIELPDWAMTDMDVSSEIVEEPF